MGTRLKGTSRGTTARIAACAIALLLVPLAVKGQSATPVASPEAPATGAITRAAGQLENPRGLAWGDDGLMYVSLAGNGGTTITTSDDASPEDEVVGPTMTGQTASVVRIDGECGTPFVVGLPSTQDPYGDVQGPVDVGFLDGQMYVLQDATGGYEAVGPDFPNGIYALNPDGSVRLISDLSAYVAANPAGNLYHVLELGEPFAFAPGDGGFWVIDANQGLLLWVALSGQVTLIADLSEGHPVPTAITVAPDGAIYVGFLTPNPHTEGSAKVVRVDPDDYTVTDYWTGLTTVTGLATDAMGNLYAVEMATGIQPTDPNILPNTGRLVRQTGPGSMDVLVTGLDFPISMDSGPDGALYISLPAIATSDELGGIVRVDPTLITDPVAMPDGLLATSPCAPPATPVAEPDLVPATIPAASPEASIDSTPDAAAPAASPEIADHEDGDKQGIASTGIAIQDFAFNPADETVPVGSIVSWSNLDPASHTVTASDGSFDSGNLDSGTAFVHEFESAGTFTYVCQYHPNMTGTITVE